MCKCAQYESRLEYKKCVVINVVLYFLIPYTRIMFLGNKNLKNGDLQSIKYFKNSNMKHTVKKVLFLKGFEIPECKGHRMCHPLLGSTWHQPLLERGKKGPWVTGQEASCPSLICGVGTWPRRPLWGPNEEKSQGPDGGVQEKHIFPEV